jgi:hypothetical protein
LQGPCHLSRYRRAYPEEVANGNDYEETQEAPKPSTRSLPEWETIVTHTFSPNPRTLPPEPRTVADEDSETLKVATALSRQQDEAADGESFGGGIKMTAALRQSSTTGGPPPPGGVEQSDHPIEVVRLDPCARSTR